MGFFHRIKAFWAARGANSAAPPPASRKARGDAAEAAAIAWLQQKGLTLLERNYHTPGRGGGEIDAIMRAADGTLVFVEVRLRASSDQGGAAASVGSTKQRRIIRAARHYLQRMQAPPPCRFDVMACDNAAPPWQWNWLVAAFDAHE
ncbi:MAG: YraN family protein [Brachymonas sp.]|nr:YraN family protein [Brachymonas sp.]